ncbi:MAG: metallophosphoesterase [Deltaproteobacteria bacterium]|nr:metallophosphoesterase [Deltaproteobacteria bacterium]
MNRISSAWKRLTTAVQDRPYNLLVLSDLHLGQDLKAPKAAQRQAEPREGKLDKELVRFLDHHATHRVSDKPWRLVLDGDIVDFVAITLTPVPGSDIGFPISQEERRDGLAAEEDKCVWKLRRVSDRHPAVFDALARFVLAGHEVHVIRGNHDPEFAFAGVQAAWRELIIERCEAMAAERGQCAVHEALEDALKFHAWFYLEPGFLYIEHGNAHDRYCLQEGFFDVEPENRHEGKALAARELALPMSSNVLRYFVNRYEAAEEDLAEADSWGALQYIAWIFRAGNPLQIAADYFVMVARLLLPIVQNSLGLTRRAARLAGRALKRVGDEERTAFAQKMLSRFADDSTGAAQKLARLAQRPAEESLFDAAQLFYVDRMALALIALVVAAVSMHELPAMWMKLSALVVVGMAFSLGSAALGRLRRADAHPLLQTAARRIAQIFGVHYVVMGHSHKAVDEAIGTRARYLNPGSWTTVKNEGFPHIVVVGREAKLVRWRGPAEQVSELAEIVRAREARESAALVAQTAA